MAKAKLPSLNVHELVKDLKNQKFLPVYYFFGEDSYNIETAVKAVENAVAPFISSDFDKETFYGEDRSLADVLSFAAAFPFGSGKKLIIFKEFEKVKDKKVLVQYLQSPPEFTALILIHNGSITNPDSEPYRSLSSNKMIFESKELKGDTLLNWVISYAESKNKNIPPENAQLLIDIAGENRSMIEAQLEKIFTFLGESKDISVDVIRSLSTSLREYTIFDLQNALGKKNKKNALKIAFNMLEKGNDLTYIIYMLVRYYTGLARIAEMQQLKIPDAEAARVVGTNFYYYKDYLAARKMYSDAQLANAVKALLDAEVALKSTSTDVKSLLTILIAEILK